MTAVPAPVTAAATFGAFGVAVVLLGPTSPLILLAMAAVWAVVVIARIGTGPVVTVAMMAVAFTAPMNGLRFFRVAATDVVLAVAILGLAVEVLVTKRRWRPLPPGFTFGTVLVVGGGLIGTLYAARPGASLASLLPFTLAATVPVIVLRMWAPSVASLRRYAWCWVCGAAVSGTIGLLSTGGITGRPEGLTPHPNHLAMTCALAGGIALALWLSEVGWRRHVMLGMFGLLILTVVRAGSRAALVGLLVGAVIVVFTTRRLRPAPERIGRGALALLALGVVTGGLLITGAVEVGEQNAVQRLLGDRSARASNAERLTLLEKNVDRIGDRPLTGNGFEEARQAHNIYVQVWAAAGVPGLLGFVMLIVAVVREGVRTLAEPGVRSMYLASAFLAGYVGYLFAGLAQNVLWDRYVWLHVAVILWARTAADTKEPAVTTCA